LTTYLLVIRRLENVSDRTPRASEHGWKWQIDHIHRGVFLRARHVLAALAHTIVEELRR
jgi:hypothetical protein